MGIEGFDIDNWLNEKISTAGGDWRLIVGGALTVAAEAHARQKRKFTGEDYISHPLAVAAAVSNSISVRAASATRRVVSTFEVEAICIALLHDVLEDSDLTSETLLRKLAGVTEPLPADSQKEFQNISRIVLGVEFLTNTPSTGAANREMRHELDKMRLAHAPITAKIVKCCDIYDNSVSLTQHDPKFAKVWLDEKIDIIEAMKAEIDFEHESAYTCRALDRVFDRRHIDFMRMSLAAATVGHPYKEIYNNAK